MNDQSNVAISRRDMGHLRVAFDGPLGEMMRGAGINPHECWLSAAAAMVCEMAGVNPGQFFVRLAQGDLGAEKEAGTPTYRFGAYDRTSAGDRLSDKLFLVAYPGAGGGEATLIVASEY
jgi:hypothetical protein